MSKAKFEPEPTAPDWDDRAIMFMIPAFDVEPNSNFMQWVAAEYEAEYAFNENLMGKYASSAERAVMNAWNRMMDRAPLDPHHPRNVKE